MANGGMRKPKNIRFGTDFAGVIEAVGKNVTEFAVMKSSARRTGPCRNASASRPSAPS
jgi:NADPH:quinone reductase-like Zn-dependent oxidoreductase